MATFVYDHTVKANGRLVPPNTPVEMPEDTTAEKSSATENAAPKKKTTRRKAAVK